jgi:anti-sigma factor RsiW
MNLPVQHLSDEAVAAFADGVLSSGPRARAERHLASCAECSYSVAEQRAAVWALRAAPAPSLPGGLLDRLRDLPSTTALPSSTVVLAPDGSAAFPAYGMHGDRHPGRLTRLMPMSVPARRRGQQVVLVTAAAALVVIGAAGSSAGPSVTGPDTAQQIARVGPAGSSSGNLATYVHDVSSSGR